MFCELHFGVASVQRMELLLKVLYNSSEVQMQTDFWQMKASGWGLADKKSNKRQFGINWESDFLYVMDSLKMQEASVCFDFLYVLSKYYSVLILRLDYGL